MTVMQRMRELRRSIRGQSLVEFAMVLPLMLVIVFMITEFGRALWIKNTLTQAAREGARDAVVASVDDGVKLTTAKLSTERFLTDVGLLGDTAPTPLPEVTVEGLDVDGDGADDHLRVQVTNDFSFIPGGELSANPFASGAVVVPTGFTIRADAVMKYE
jgi:Flp pilus assembly protein TadG